jgi:hypothetical protein
MKNLRENIFTLIIVCLLIGLIPTLAFSYSQITGAEIANSSIDLTTKVKNNLPTSNGGTGAATAGAARTALGLEIGIDIQAYNANTAFTNTVNAFSKQQGVTPQALTSSSNHIAWNATNGNNASHTATENTTLDNPTNLVAGTFYTFVWTQHASSAKTLAYGNKWKFYGSSTVSSTTSAVNVINCVYDGTNLDCTMAGPFS